LGTISRPLDLSCQTPLSSLAECAASVVHEGRGWLVGKLTSRATDQLKRHDKSPWEETAQYEG